MKNHEWVDGKLLQTNKKYSHLKLKQKEKIYQWMYESYQKAFREKGTYPADSDDEEIVLRVMEKIEEADIRIPYSEVRKHFRSIKENLHKRLAKEERSRSADSIIIEPIDLEFSVCRVEDYSGINIEDTFCFIGNTDEEKSLVCPKDQVPDQTLESEDGWRCFRISGKLDFSLIGIMARITKLLANNGISVFVVSTFNTDYVLTRENRFSDALHVLKSTGYQIVEEREWKDQDES